MIGIAAGLVALIVTGLTLAPTSGILAGLVAFVALVIAGLWMEKRGPVPNDGHDAPHVPTAYVVTARRSRTVAWDQLVGRILLVIVAGVCLLLLAPIVVAVAWG